MVIIGTLVGAALATIGYLVLVVSIPLAPDKSVDALAAMRVSVVSGGRNKGAMLAFAVNIAMLIALSFATGVKTPIFIFPWLGHATWHSYRAVTG